MTEKVRLENINFWYHGLFLLQGINLSVYEGETCLITGCSGSGKSKLLEICAGLLNPETGTIYWDGKSTRTFSHRQILEYRKKIGYVFQSHALISNLTIFDNLALPLRYHSDTKEAAIKQLVTEHLHVVDLQSLAHKLPEQLSQGQKRWAAIARAFIMEPDVLFMDEPCNELDPLEIRDFIALIETIRQKRPLTVIMTSNINEVIRRMEAPIYVLEGGHLLSYDHYMNEEIQYLPEIISYLRQKL